jgi:hypothetical protein
LPHDADGRRTHRHIQAAAAADAEDSTTSTLYMFDFSPGLSIDQRSARNSAKAPNEASKESRP